MARAEKSIGAESRRLHYLSVPPNAALSAVRMLGDAGWCRTRASSWKSRSAPTWRAPCALNAKLHEVFAEEQIFRIDHFLGKEPAQNILAFRFANGLFEPIWNRNFIDHVQIDVPETLGLGKRSAFYESTGAYRDMVVTHLFQILGFMAMEPPTHLAPKPISEEKNKVFRSMLPIQPADVVRGQYIGYRGEEGVAPESDTETFIALKCSIDNWRWAGVPFYLRTGKRLAEGQRIISIAFREPPKSMFPEGSGIGAHGPDHLTFDLADAAQTSLSFYGKRPGPGMRLDKHSLQFAMNDTGQIGDVLEAYERLILDAMRGDHTLFTTAEGIERLWEVSVPLLEVAAAGAHVFARAPGGRTRSTSSSRRTRGGCRSSAPGAIRTSRAASASHAMRANSWLHSSEGGHMSRIWYGIVLLCVAGICQAQVGPQGQGGPEIGRSIESGHRRGRAALKVADPKAVEIPLVSPARRFRRCSRRSPRKASRSSGALKKCCRR